MKNLSIIFLLLIAASCASSADWVTNTVEFKDQRWRICSTQYGDPVEYHLNGFCYWVEQTKKRTLRSKLWRRKLQVCLYSDKVCQLKFAQSGKRMR